ncbi:MAG TPA: nicotinate-nucleotide diphosphorylase (carboxylating), partial [Micromonosporaceae bacterium]|nr:nicotinate-nucleotide diphosphorylase (carboxylating) [Micromonosporaceae bacterium]
MKESTAHALRSAGLDPVAVERIVRLALDEDLGPDLLDVTTVATVPDAQADTADLVARADGVVAGLAVAASVFETVAEAGSGRSADVASRVSDGARVAKGDVLATVAGRTRALLTAERTALNLLCRMSGVA